MQLSNSSIFDGIGIIYAIFSNLVNLSNTINGQTIFTGCESIHVGGQMIYVYVSQSDF